LSSVFCDLRFSVVNAGVMEANLFCHWCINDIKNTLYISIDKTCYFASNHKINHSILNNNSKYNLSTCLRCELSFFAEPYLFQWLNEVFGIFGVSLLALIVAFNRFAGFLKFES
jgi:hypothetical protein